MLSGGRSSPSLSTSAQSSPYSSGVSAQSSVSSGNPWMVASQLEMAKKEIESFKKEIDRLKKSIQEKDKEKERDREKNRKEFERQKNVIGEQERSMASLKQKIQSLEKESTNLTTNLRKAEDTGRGSNKEIERIRAENADLKMQVNELKMGLTEARKETQKTAAGLKETGRVRSHAHELASDVMIAVGGGKLQLEDAVVQHQAAATTNQRPAKTTGGRGTEGDQVPTRGRRRTTKGGKQHNFDPDPTE